MRTLVVIVGPTAVGKTEVAIRLAERIGGEIVSADSRQVYRYMDIGTAKPSAEQRARALHHLIDVVDPDEAFSLAQYQSAAYAAIDDIFARGKQPLLAGGTGLYVKAVSEGLRIPPVPPHPGLRAELEAQAASPGGKYVLYAELQRVDPAAAARIDPRNVRRTIRALEVYRLSGARFSELGRVQPPYRVITIGLTRPRPDLYRRIDARIDAMVATGLVEEARWLAQRYDWSLPSMSSLGYRQIGAFLRGACSLAEAVAALRRDSRRFVRRQANWFRLSDPRISWLEMRIDVDRDLLTILQRKSDKVE